MHYTWIEVSETKKGLEAERKYLIFYKKINRSKDARSLEKSLFVGNSVMHIEVEQACLFSKECSASSAPIVKFTINDVEFQTSVPSIGGKNPQWIKKHQIEEKTKEEDNENMNGVGVGGGVMIPLKKIQPHKEDSSFRIEVVDPFDPKIEYGTCTLDMSIVRNWIASSYYQGTITLDNHNGMEMGEIVIQVRLKSNEYLIDLLDPRGISDRREKAAEEKAREEER